jgi:hypothetical protein
MAGSDITASPSQLVERTHTRATEEGLKSTVEKKLSVVSYQFTVKTNRLAPDG